MKRFSPFIKSTCTLALLFMFVFVTGGLDMVVKAVQAVTQNSAPPIVAQKDASGTDGWLVSGDVSVFYSSSTGKYYLFLPSSADLTRVLVRYTGSYMLYDPDTGKTYSKNQTARLNLSGGSTYIYESRSGSYYKYPITVMKGEGTTSIFFNLTNGDSDLIKVNTSKSYEVTGAASVSTSSGKMLYSGAMTKFKGRGNGSYAATGIKETKNSYSFNLEDSAKLLDNAKKKKKYALLRMRSVDPPWDSTGLSFPMAYDSYNALVGSGHEDLDTEYVDVYINNEYRGVYVLSERMDINSAIDVNDLEDVTTYSDASTATETSSSDPAIAAGVAYYTYCKNASVPAGTDITGGYILEITDGICSFRTAHGLTFGLQSPKYATKAQVQYIAKYVQDFENALFSSTGYNSSGKYYGDYIDMGSLASQMLVYGFYLNWEFYRTSTFFYKDADGTTNEKLTFMLWDFECSASEMAASDAPFFSKRYAYEYEFQFAWAQQLWQKGDFLAAMCTKNKEFDTIIQQILGQKTATDVRSISSLINASRSSQLMNWIRWTEYPSSYDSMSQTMRNAMQARYNRWFGNIWSTSYLLGCTVSATKNSNGTVTLKATALGTGRSYQWYRVNSSIPTSAVAVSGANSQTYTPQQDGIYYCTVRGSNNAYYKGSTPNNSPIFSSSSITMASASIDTVAVKTAPTPTPKPTPTLKPTPSPAPTQKPTGQPVTLPPTPDITENTTGTPGNTLATLTPTPTPSGNPSIETTDKSGTNAIDNPTSGGTNGDDDNGSGSTMRTIAFVLLGLSVVFAASVFIIKKKRLK